MRTAYFSLLIVLLVCTCGRADENKAGTSADDTTVAVPAAPYQDLGPLDFAERMGDPNAVLLDVRTPAEIANGKIDGALEIDYRSPDFARRIGELDTTKTYLVYCASGGRSSQTCEQMAAAGFGKLYNLKGGYSAWRQ